MSSSSFKEHEKLGDASNFAAWKVILEIIADNNDVLEYIQGRMPDPPKNDSAYLINKKGESKAKKIIVDSLQDHLLAYVGNLRKSKEMYDNIVGMYEVKNLSHIMDLKNQLKESKMHKGETIQSIFMRIIEITDQLPWNW